MRTTVLSALLMLFTSACTDDALCHDGVCSDLDEPRALPGPCAMATNSFVKRCDMSYDSDARPSLARCTIYGGLEDETEQLEVRWTYGEGNGLATLERETIGQSITRWTFGPKFVRVVGVNPKTHTTFPMRIYDRALFAFDPGVGVTSTVYPTAELGLISDDGSDTPKYSWSRQGSRLTRSGGDTPRVYELDSKNRLVTNSNLHYTYDGDRLAAMSDGTSVWTYTYDRGGNIAEATSNLGTSESYSYECW